MSEPIHFQTHYAADLLVRANRAYLVRSFGAKRAAAFAALILGWAALLLTGERGWLVGAVGAAIVIMAMFVFAVYQVTIRRAITRLAAMQSRTADVTLTEETFAVRSDLGAAELPWLRITKLWQYTDFWLVFYEGHNNYFVLPLAGVDKAALELMQAKISQAGGRTVET